MEKTVDPWSEQKNELQQFWSKVFKYTIDWNDFVLPPYSDRYSQLNIRPEFFSGEHIYNGITRCKVISFYQRNIILFGEKIDRTLEKAEAVQSRPKGNYAWANGDTAESDIEYWGQSYDNAINSKLTFMDPVEYILSSAHYEFSTGNTYDPNSLTCLSVLLSDKVSLVAGSLGVANSLYLSFQDRSLQHKKSGPRVVVLAV